MVANRHQELITELIDTNLAVGDQIQFMVVSNSMSPLIRAGDSLVADIIKPDAIKPGDIVLIRREADFLTHRALKLINHRWLTKGDSTVEMDPRSKTNNIIGRVVTIHKPDRSIQLQTGQWTRLNPILARLSRLEAEFSDIQPLLRLPFRFGIKLIHRYLIWRGH
jgi:signal peptidase I